MPLEVVPGVIDSTGHRYPILQKACLIHRLGGVLIEEIHQRGNGLAGSLAHQPMA
jgi:hypothetical protein